MILSESNRRKQWEISQKKWKPPIKLDLVLLSVYFTFTERIKHLIVVKSLKENQNAAQSSLDYVIAFIRNFTDIIHNILSVYFRVIYYLKKKQTKNTQHPPQKP